jgi:hypothetical protein
MSSLNHFSPLADSNEGVAYDSPERKSFDHQLVPLTTCLLILGASLNFYGMWNLKLGPEDWRGIAALIVGIPCCACGVNLLLDVIA